MAAAARSLKGSLAASRTAGGSKANTITATQHISFPQLVKDIEGLSLESLGWDGLDAKYAELQALLSAPTSGLNASQARQMQKMHVTAAIAALLDKAQQECRRLLIAGDSRGAVEGGLRTLRLKEDYYGDGTLPLVPSYFHLARTNQFLDKFKAAEEFLSLAQWTILQHPEADVSLKAELHQTFGLLYASDGKLDAALKQLTCATYYLSAMNGPEHVMTAFGYFDLGNVFAAKANMENAMAFYDKVKDIWHAHLTQALRLRLEAIDAENAAAAAFLPPGTAAKKDLTAALPMGTPEAFGDENLEDASKMLRGILALQAERYTSVHPSTARAAYVLGMFLLWIRDRGGALETSLRAVEACKRLYGDRHPATVEIRQMLLAFEFQIPEDTSSFIDLTAEASPAAPPAPVAAAVTPVSAPPAEADVVERQEAPKHVAPSTTARPAVDPVDHVPDPPSPEAPVAGDVGEDGAGRDAEPPVPPATDAPEAEGGTADGSLVDGSTTAAEAGAEPAAATGESAGEAVAEEPRPTAAVVEEAATTGS